MADFRIRFGKQQPSFASARPRLLGLSIHLRLTVFIVPITKGAFSLKKRHATEWRLTAFPCDVTGAWATKDFMRWQKPSTARPSNAPAVDATGRATALFNGAPALSNEMQSKGNDDSERGKAKDNTDSSCQ